MSLDIKTIFTPEFSEQLQKLQEFSAEILQIKNEANNLYFDQNYEFAEQEYKHVLETFKEFT